MTKSSFAPPPAASAHETVAADLLYWGVLDGTSTIPSSRSNSRRTAQWTYAFEDLLPIAAEDVACAFLRTGDKVIACGLPLEELAPRVGWRTRTLCPDAIPDWVREEAGVDGTPPPQSLNLLTCGREPPAAQRARRRHLVHVAAMSVCLLAVLIAGAERRISALNARAAAAEARAAAAYARVLPPTASAQPPVVRLASELRALERLMVRPSAASAGMSPATDLRDFDAAVALSQLLALVPEMHLACDSLDIAPGRAGLIATVATADDAQRLAAAFDSGAGPWKLRQPQVSAETGPDGQPAVRVSITLEAAPVGAATLDARP